MIPFVLWLLSGCLYAPQEWSDPEIYSALDYTIDRTRVLAVTFTSPTPVAGEPVLFDALVLSPYPIQDIELSICGLTTEGPFSVVEPQCFAEDSLVTTLSRGLPYTWDSPDLQAYEGFAHCEGWSEIDSDENANCASTAPVMVTATTTEDVGRADRAMPILVGTTWRFNGSPFQDLDHHLDITGDVVPGGELDLVATMELRPGGPSEPEGAEIRWFVDDGTLLGTGLTTIHNAQDYEVQAFNTLRLPDPLPDRLRVVAVMHGKFSTASPGSGRMREIAWRVEEVIQ